MDCRTPARRTNKVEPSRGETDSEADSLYCNCWLPLFEGSTCARVFVFVHKMYFFSILNFKKKVILTVKYMINVFFVTNCTVCVLSV
jgi:hypothetical protein